MGDYEMKWGEEGERWISNDGWEIAVAPDGDYLLYAGPDRGPVGKYPSVYKAMQAANEIVAVIWKYKGSF